MIPNKDQNNSNDVQEQEGGKSYQEKHFQGIDLKVDIRLDTG